MKIVDRYLGTTIIHTTLLVSLMLIGLSVFITFVKEIGDVGTGNYGLLALIEYILLDLPKQVYMLFPMVCLLGTLLGLGMLANHSELIVLRASNMSLNRIIWAILKAAILMVFVATIIGEGIAPMAEHTAEARKALLTSGGQTLNTLHGTWIRDGQNFIYIRTLVDDKHLLGVSRYEFDKQDNLINASYAKEGFYKNAGLWTMKDISNTAVTNSTVKTQQIPNAIWKLSINPNVLRISVIDPEEMSLRQLINYIGYLKTNNLNPTDYSLAFWQRALQPLATLVMIWLAIPFLFGPLRSATMGLRTVLGAVVGFTFITLNQFFGPISTIYQLPPFVAALAPIVLFAGAAFWLQTRVR